MTAFDQSAAVDAPGSAPGITSKSPGRNGPRGSCAGHVKNACPAVRVSSVDMRSAFDSRGARRLESRVCRIESSDADIQMHLRFGDGNELDLSPSHLCRILKRDRPCFQFHLHQARVRGAASIAAHKRKRQRVDTLVDMPPRRSSIVVSKNVRRSSYDFRRSPVSYTDLRVAGLLCIAIQPLPSARR